MLAQACRDHDHVEFDYTAASGDGSRRRVEPYRLVPVGRRWCSVTEMNEGRCRVEMTADSLDWAVFALGVLDADFDIVAPDELDNDLAAIEDSFGVLEGVPTAGRGPDERAAHLDRVRRA